MTHQIAPLLNRIYLAHRDDLITDLENFLSDNGQLDPLALNDIAESLLDAMMRAVNEDDRRYMVASLFQIAYSLKGERKVATIFTFLQGLENLKHTFARFINSKERLKFYQKHIRLLDDWFHLTRNRLFEQVYTRAVEHQKNETALIQKRLTDLETETAHANSVVDSLLNLRSEYFSILLDSDNRIQQFSYTAQQLLGYDPVEVMGRGPEVLHSEAFNTEGSMDKVREEILSAQYFSGEVPYRHKDGHELTVQVAITQIRSAKGEILGYLAVGRDMSEQRQLQEQLLRYTNDLQQILAERSRDLDESEERYRHLVEDINEGYFIAKGNELIFVNKAFANITGFTRQELKGRPVLDLIVKRNDAKAQAWWENVKTGRYIKPVEFLIARKDAKKAVVECKAQPVEMRDEPHVIGVLHDITDKKIMERQLRRYVDNLERMVAERTKELENSLDEVKSMHFQLVQSEKLAGIGILAAGVAHEINNPLQALLLKSQHILRHIDNKLTVQSATRDIVKYVNRMAEIVRGLSKYARSMKEDETVVANPIDLVEIIKESLELSYHTRNFGDIIVKRDFEPVAQVRGNRGQYQQVFINLIVNAIDAMEGRGKLTLRLKPQDSRFVLAEVEDTGHGIADEHLERIFTPLFTTKPTGKGTGMGLHVSYRIITQYGGDIKVSSEVGNGTIFSLLFPIFEENETPPKTE